MLSVATSIERPMKETLERDEEIRKIFLDVFGFIDNGIQDVEKANIVFIADLGVQIFNVFYSLRNPKSGLGYRVVMDLTVNLNSNPVWVKHGPVLMPLLHAALQAQSDYALLSVEKSQNPNAIKDDEIRAQCKLSSLEIFSMLAFLQGGQVGMQMHSLELKRRLAPYFE